MNEMMNMNDSCDLSGLRHELNNFNMNLYESPPLQLRQCTTTAIKQQI